MTRVTLWQLLVWVTGCGVYFAAIRGKLPGLPRSLWGDILLSLLAAGVGLGWVGVMQVLRLSPPRGKHRDLAGQGPRAASSPTPGTWLLAAIGLIAAVDLAVATAFATSTARSEVLRQIATCLAFLGPSLSRHLPRVWRYYFLVLALHEAARLVASCLGVLDVSVPGPWTTLISPWVRSVVALIGLAAVIAVDREKHASRDWLHFAGLLVGAAFFVARAWI